MPDQICRDCGDCDVDWRCVCCGGGLCDRCWDEPAWYTDYCPDCRDASCHTVYSYDYRPYFRAKGNPAEPMLGVELEVGGSARRIGDAVYAVDASEDHLYMKEDGSISGVEIVTHPMTLAWARQYPFDTLLAGLRAAGCEERTGSGYGLHIHVGRNSFRAHPAKGKRGHRSTHRQQSSPHQMMWLLFMYRNVDELTKLARRTSHDWASFSPPRPGELKQKAQGGRVGARYVAVNCLNSETFELRFFRSTLSDREFYAALEFADASVRYTAGLTTQDVLKGRVLTWKHFTQWVERHNYKQLHAEIASRCP